jgi:hypothetical protein
MNKEEIKNKANNELENVYEGRATRDSGMPLFEGSIVTLILPDNDSDPFFIKESNYYRWRTKGNESVSLSQTGRRGNGLNLTGNTDKERNASLQEMLIESGEISLRITKTKQKRSMFDGVESLNNYLFFERV